MNIDTKFNVGQTVMVKPGDRPAHLPNDENNIGKIIGISAVNVSAQVTEIEYELEFKDPDTGEVDPDWNEIYLEDMLTEVK